MTSLPMPTCWTEPVLAALPSGLSEPTIGSPRREDEPFLFRAFRFFLCALAYLIF
jgi:hypothetical protein